MQPIGVRVRALHGVGNPYGYGYEGGFGQDHYTNKVCSVGGIRTTAVTSHKEILYVPLNSEEGF